MLNKLQFSDSNLLFQFVSILRHSNRYLIKVDGSRDISWKKIHFNKTKAMVGGTNREGRPGLARQARQPAGGVGQAGGITWQVG
jgi:hypothetical protein